MYQIETCSTFLSLRELRTFKFEQLRVFNKYALEDSDAVIVGSTSENPLVLV